MAEYIEREALKSQIAENKLMAREPAAKRILAMIDDIPAADVAPVVHGRWVNGCQCSVCGDRHGPYNSRHRPYYNFCPNCGAKMDEEEHDNV